MAYTPRNPNGQATSANSAPVVIASDQSAVAVSNAGLTSLNGAIAGTEVQVDVVGALPAGTNNIGDVDVLTLPSTNFTDVLVTGQGSQTALNQNIILASAGTGSYDTMGTSGITYRSMAIQIVPASGTVTAGVISFEGSNDNTNFVAVFLTDSANVTAIPVSTVTLAANTPRYFIGAIPFRYIRARISTGITGTTTGVQAHTVFSTVPFSSPRLTVSQATAASLNTTVTGTVTANLGTGGTSATSLGKAEDAVAATGDTGVAVFAVRRDTPSSDVSAAGDYATLQVNATGSLWTQDTSNLADDAAFTPATSRIIPVGYFADETATDSVDEGDAGIARMTLDRKQIVAPYAHTAGGATPYKLNSAASTNATSVKASAGQIYSIACMNTNASARYLKLYNKASAPTVGTDTPVQVYTIPGNTAGSGMTITFPVGLSFGTGIAFALTTGAADSDTGAVAANEIIVNLSYV